jgi:hypothetical protein
MNKNKDQIHEDLKGEYIGKVFKTNSYGDCVVIDYRDSKRVKVRFENTGYETEVPSGNLRKGLVKDCLAKCVAGVGFLGVGKYICRVKGRSAKDGGYRAGCRTLEYVFWESMMKRVYNHQNECMVRNYSDVSVCEEWHNYQNFAEWCQTQTGFKMGFHLDKDLLLEGNKVYSPTTCCFIPPHLNAAITGMKHTNTTGYTGVVLTDTGRFLAGITMNGVGINLGTYDTKQQASLMYKSIKNAYVNSLAIIYKDEISIEAFTAAQKWCAND